MVARHGAEVIHSMDSTSMPLRGQNVGLSAPTPRHSVSHQQWSVSYTHLTLPTNREV